MANLNRVFLMGNLTRDIELSYLPSNQNACANFGLAINRNWTGADGQKKEEVTFVDCVSFGKGAEVLAKYVKKGSPLFVDGRLKLDQWEKDGAKRSKLTVVVENFQFLSSGNGQSEQQPARQPAPATRPAARPAPQPEYQGESAGPAMDQDIPFNPHLI
jgi:single-strand DNA-binding protein